LPRYRCVSTAAAFALIFETAIFLFFLFEI
jgi:hypothetical protein